MPAQVYCTTLGGTIYHSLSRASIKEGVNLESFKCNKADYREGCLYCSLLPNDMKDFRLNPDNGTLRTNCGILKTIITNVTR